MKDIPLKRNVGDIVTVSLNEGFSGGRIVTRVFIICGYYQNREGYWVYVGRLKDDIPIDLDNSDDYQAVSRNVPIYFAESQIQ